MKINLKTLTDDLIRDEGVVYHTYRDSLNKPTFGVGHLVKKGDPEYRKPNKTPVSHKRVWSVFMEDLQKHIEEAESLYGNSWDTFPGEVQEILINMTFNMGKSRLMKFKKMNAALKEHDWQEAAKEGRDSRWYKQVTNRAERLMVRLESLGE